MNAPLSRYAEHRLRLLSLAEEWDQLAETTRQAGRFSVSRQANDNAIRCRWLAEPDPEVEALFNEAG